MRKILNWDVIWNDLHRLWEYAEANPKDIAWAVGFLVFMYLLVHFK